jgi:hypothetical protein
LNKEGTPFPEPEKTPESGNIPEFRALLDTTVQLDRLKTASRKEFLEKILANFRWKFAASISLVEFKATIIQECITIHNQLRRKGSRFTKVRDALLEKQHPQISLRSHIFNNLVNIYGSSFEVNEGEDLRLAEKARLNLENIIPRLYKWFTEESVDAVLKDRLKCNRAEEPPRKKQAAFEANLPICRRGKNKSCFVEKVICNNSPELISRLQSILASSDQLQRASEVFQSVLQNPTRDLSHSDCRRAGDCLIALEAQETATHVLSSNAREWQPLSQAVGFEFVPITFPEEKTK